MVDSDREYVMQCLDGHPEAYEGLVRRYQSPLLAYIGGKVRDREVAEETAQEAFVRAFFGLRSLKKPESFFPWLVGVALRVLKERWREPKGSPLELARAQVAATTGDSVDYDLEEAVSSLPDECRDTILLRYYQGLTCGEIAARSGTPVGTVTKRLSRAYAMLRERLGPRERVDRGKEEPR